MRKNSKKVKWIHLSLRTTTSGRSSGPFSCESEEKETRKHVRQGREEKKAKGARIEKLGPEQREGERYS